MEFLVYVRTKNDINGNPRRGWIVATRDNLFVDEGYNGRWALYRALGLAGLSDEARAVRVKFDNTCIEVPLDVTVAQYNQLKRGV